MTNSVKSGFSLSSLSRPSSVSSTSIRESFANSYDNLSTNSPPAELPVSASNNNTNSERGNNNRCTRKDKLIILAIVFTPTIITAIFGVSYLVYFKNDDDSESQNPIVMPPTLSHVGDDLIRSKTVAPTIIMSLSPSMSMNHPSLLNNNTNMNNTSSIIDQSYQSHSLKPSSYPLHSITTYSSSSNLTTGLSPPNKSTSIIPSTSSTPTQASISSSISISPTIKSHPSSTPSTSTSIKSTTSLYAEISEAIATLYPDNSTSPLLNSSTPQSKALTWMTYNDKYKSSSNDDLIQRYTIVVLYFSFYANTWNRNINWMTHSDVCRWYGVLCYNYPNNITVNQILLNDNGLKGSIPPEISLLHELDHIDLGNNYITGAIPSSIGLLSKLYDLRLYSNNINSIIPSDIGKLFSLRILYLDHNKLHSAIPIEFWNAYSLKDIKLNNNLLQGTISTSLNTLSNLERFWISDNQFIGQFPDSLQMMMSLKYLYIDNNQFTGYFPEYLPQVMINLQDLRMSNNFISGCIPKTIFEMQYLETLYLDVNSFECELFPEIYNGPALVDLQMQNNKFYGKLPLVLDHVSKLNYLDISNNNLSDLPNEFVPLRYIKYLALSNNKIRGQIPPNLGLLADLEMIKLDNNLLSGSVPMEIHALTKMKLLLLDNNNLVGTMPTAICDIQYSNSALITTDCAGEYPLVECNCCSNCNILMS